MLLCLLVGAGALLGSLLLYAMAMDVIVRLVVCLIRRGYTNLGFWNSVAVMMFVTLITAVAHLGPITLWALTLLLIGEISPLEGAFYLSAENYTALGYGDILMSERWRLLGPLEAVNGLLLFGVSAAVLFAIMSHLIANRLRRQIGSKHEVVVNPDPLSAAGANRPESGNS